MHGSQENIIRSLQAIPPGSCCSNYANGCISQERFRANRRKVIMVSISVLVVLVIVLITLGCTMIQNQDHDDNELQMINLVNSKSFTII